MFTILGADGKEYGPVTAGKLHEWIAAGRANLQTKARRDGETEWKTLAEFPEVSQLGTSGSAPPQTVFPSGVPVLPGANATATLELEPASRWLRLGAILLDNIIGGIFLLPGFCVMLTAGFFTNTDMAQTPLLLAGFGVLGFGVLVLMGIQIYLLTTRGQSIGKKLLGIKIVNFDDEANPGFVKAFLLRAFVNGLIGAIPFLGLAYTLTDIFFIFRDDRRCLHDLLAGTKVVKA